MAFAACGDDDGGGGGGRDGGGLDDATPVDDALHPTDGAPVDRDGGGLDAGLDGAVGCPDGDGDTVCDADDVCPGSDDLSDGDGDNVPDGCDLCPGSDDGTDGDGDSVPDGCDICPTGDDGTDGDGDSVPDACDVCPGGDDSVDPDADGRPSFCDNCPADPNPNQRDADGDGLGNACDNCVLVDNPGQENGDGDSRGDDCDNCPAIANDQTNSDTDSRGDVCDNCPTTDNDSQTNSDGDSLGDDCDNCPTVINEAQVNTDGDSRGDACDNCPRVTNENQANSHGIAAISVPFTGALSCDDDGGTPGIECTPISFLNGLSTPIRLASVGQTLNFTFFGRVYTHVRVSSSGLVYLGTGANNTDFAGVLAGDGGGGQIPLYDTADTLVGGVWTDIQNPVFSYDQLGTGANNSFIVNVSGDGISSQIAFFEAFNRIEIRTIQLAAGGTVDTRGIEGLFDGRQPPCILDGVCSFGENCLNCATDCCGAAPSQEYFEETFFGYVGAAFLSEDPAGSDESAAPLGLLTSQVTYTSSPVVDGVGDACDNFAVVPACGDGFCNAYCNLNVSSACEDAGNCADCSCGDGVCDPTEFDDSGVLVFCSCGADCAPCCGDGVCNPIDGEDANTCSDDCSCGDGVCDPTEIDDSGPIPYCSCAADCSACCGDGFCDTGSGEDSFNCSDCFCGDGICDLFESLGGICPLDCGF